MQSWQQPTKDEEQTDDERQQVGISQQDWEAAYAWVDSDEPTPADGPFLVWECNWETVMAFMACQTQWVRNWRGGFDGLNYTGVDVVIRRRKLKEDPDEVFARLQVMERAALEVFHG